MQVTFHKIEGCQYLDYRLIKTLQGTQEGSLKDLSKERYEKLLESLKEHGFTFPGFVWEKSEGEYYAVDMHQRLRVMSQEDANDHGSYEVPVVFIPAKDEKEAKKKLLLATSQFGRITQEGLDAFIAEAELPEAEVYEAVAFDALPFLGMTTPDDEPKVKNKNVDDKEECPTCGTMVNADKLQV